MTEPIRIWTASAHHAAFRCGGWASVRVGGGPIAGVAGGERNTTARRMALAGLAAALRGLPPADGEPVNIQTSSADLASLAPWLAAGAGEGGPQEDLDLWAQILTAAKGRRMSLALGPPQPATPMAFAAAWADQALTKAKAAGPFTAPIPRNNLARIPGLTPR